MKKPILFCIACTLLGLALVIAMMATLEIGLRAKERWGSSGASPARNLAFTEEESFGAPIFVPSPFTLVYNKPMMKLANLTTNSLGFRGRKELPERKDPRTKRVFVIGGSAAVGMNASTDEKTMPAQLEVFLRQQMKNSRIEVYNAAAAGFNSIQDLIYLAKNVVHYEPDLIIDFAGGTDINTSMEEKWHPNFHEMEEGYLSQLTHPWYTHSHAARAIQSLFPKKTVSRNGVFHPEVAKVYAKNVIQMANIAHGFNVPFVAMLQPAIVASAKKRTPEEEEKLATTLKRGGLVTQYEELAKKLYPVVQAEMKRTALPAKTYFIDGTTLFDGESFSAFSDAFHLTDEGYRFTATKIGQFIVDKKLL